MEGGLAVFGHSIISMCIHVQPKDKFLGHVNKDAHGSIVWDSKSKSTDNWNANKLGAG